MTDSEIAKHDGSTKQHRELVPWDGGDDSIDVHDSLGLDSSLDDHSGLSLGGGGVSNGWKTEDMFKLNESKYNIETTYQDDMSEYTIKLEHRNDEEYRQREAQAAKIAREIEQDSTRVARYSKEDELDEESRYSAVIRSDPDITESGSNMASPSNNYNNNNHHHHYRNDMNHHPSRDQPDRNRDNNLRNSNSGDNLGGFRTQTSRQSRNRMNTNRNSSGGSGGVDRSGGGQSIGPNEANWRDANSRVSADHRYHQQQSQQPYRSAQNPNKPNSGYVDRKYNAINSQQQSSSQQQQPQQTYQSSAASQANNNIKSSYSSVSARNISNDIMAATNEMETIKTFARSSGQPPSSNDPDNVGYQRKTSSGNNSNSLPQRESFKQQRTPYNRVVEQQQPQPHHHQSHQHHSSQQSHSESKMPSNNKSLESSDMSSTKSSLPTSPSSGPSSNISTPTAESSLMKSQSVATNFASKAAEIHQSKSNDQNYQSQARITSPKQGLDIVNNNNNRKLPDSLPAGENGRPTMVDAVKKGANMNQQQQPQQPSKSLIISSKDSVDSNESKKLPSDLTVTQTSPLSSTILNNPATTSNSITTASVSFTSTGNTATTTVTTSSSSTITVQQQQQQPQQSTTASSTPSSVDAHEIVVTSKLNPNAKIFTPRAVQMPTATPPQQQNPQQVVAPIPPHNYPSPHAPYQSVVAGHMPATTPPSIPSTPSLAGPAGTGQFIPYTHPHPGGGGPPGQHLTGHAAHHQQQSIRYPIQFQYNPMMPHQMVPQYIAIQHFATSMPAGAVTATAPPTVASQQSSGGPSNQQPPPGSSHHMISANAAQSMATQAGANSLVQNNGHGPQQQQGPQQQSQNVNQTQPRGHYRGGGKNGPGGNMNSNQQPQQQQLIRHQHHEAFVSQQQAQVANVTGQPIMTGATQPQHLPVVFPGQVHHHHHAPNQIHHSQQAGQNAAMAAQLAASAQPGHHNQALTHFMYPAGFPPRPLLATHQSHHHHPNALGMTIQPGLYAPPDSHMPTVYMQTEMPHQIVAAQSMAPPPNAMVPPPNNIPQTIVPTTGGTMPAPTGAAATSTQSSVPQGSVPTSQQSQQQPTYG